MIAELVRVVSTTLTARNGAPGRQIVVTGKGLGGGSAEAEVYNPLGVYGRPPKGAKVLLVPIAGGKTRVVVAGVNYQVVIDSLTAGETVIYSTNAAGDTLKAQIKLDALGNIEVNGNTKRFVTYGELASALSSFISALNLHVHGAAGTPPVTPMTLDISAAQTTTVKTGG